MATRASTTSDLIARDRAFFLAMALAIAATVVAGFTLQMVTGRSSFDAPWWVHVLIWGPLTVGLAVWMLRVLKAWLIAQQYTHRSTALDG